MRLHSHTLIIALFAIISLTSCAVANNFYANNANPYEKNRGTAYIAASSGMQASIDSVSENGQIHFANAVHGAMNLNAGGEIGLGKKINGRAAIHLPYILGGLGLRVGAQYSFFPKGSKFNMAIGTEAGFSLAKDSVKIFGSLIGTNPHGKSYSNADIYAPFTYNFSKKKYLTLGIRYSFNYMQVKYNAKETATFEYNPKALIYGLTYNYKSLLLEFSNIQIANGHYPSFGIGLMLDYRDY